jgi:hypothetical protein
MEVQIRIGDLKNHFATIIGTRRVGADVLAMLHTDDRTINHVVELNINYLRERQ